MRGQKRAYIIDFDNTILDFERLRNEVISKFPNKFVFAKIYKDAKKETGYLNPQNLPEKYRNYFLNANFKRYLFPTSIKCLKRLQKNGRVIILSFGDDKYQNLKIRESGIEKIVGRRNILIVPDKKEGIVKLLKKLKAEKYTDFFVLDDVSEVLEAAFEKFPQVVNIWIRYGKYKNRLPVLRNSITFETGSFENATSFIENFIGLISPRKTHLNYSIKKGIDKNQIMDLVSYTGRDKKVSLCTHDDGRFKNKKTFESWKKRGKIIYSMTDRTGKLLGIIWFAKKKFKNINFTFGIRVYPPVRGKGLSYKFLKIVVDDFRRNNKNSGLWLSMQRGNIPAERLYKKFGFKVDEKKKSDVVMSYSK